MQDEHERLRRVRMTFGAMAAALLGWAAWIAWAQDVTIHGRGKPTTYVGTDALSWSALAACIGLALLGVMFRSKAVVVGWMALWMIAGVAFALAPALLR